MGLSESAAVHIVFLTFSLVLFAVVAMQMIAVDHKVLVGSLILLLFCVDVEEANLGTLLWS